MPDSRGDELFVTAVFLCLDTLVVRALEVMVFETRFS